MANDQASADTSLRHDLATMFQIMPQQIRQASKVAMVLGAGLAGLEFVAIFMIYPVFGFLTQSNGQGQITLPVVGVSIDQSSARTMATIALGLMITRSLLTYAYRRWWLGNTARAELILSDRLLGSYAYAPYSFHLRTSTSDLMSKSMVNVAVVCQSGLVGVVGAAADVLLVCGLGLALIAVNPVAGGVISVYLLLLALAFTRLTRRSNKRLAAEIQARYSTVYTRVSVLLHGIRELTIFGVRDEYLRSISKARRATVDANRRVALLNDLPKVVLEVTLYTTILVALLALLGMANPDEALPLVALYIVAGLRIMPTVARLLSNVALARTGSRIARTLAAEIETLDEIGPGRLNLVEVPDARSSLVLQNVSFRYGSDLDHVLDSVSLEIPFGTYCGLVGPSGSGKTTLTAIVLGLLEPSSGSIRYGDSEVVSNDPAWFTKVALLPQDVFLTEGTLAENIALGSGLDEALLAETIERAGLDRLVSELPEGTATLLGENGSRLSHGQRQRVGLARALYKQPEILVLDEPTSALDASTEAHIVESIEALRGSMTIIAVAHRTHTLAGADLIVRLGDGIVLATGTSSLLDDPEL